MAAFAGIAILLLVGVSLAVGVRLILFWLRAGGAPEILLGLMLFLSVGVGYPLLIAANQLHGEAPRFLFVASLACVNGGFALLFVFTRRVFQPRSGWARLLAAAGILALTLNFAWHAFDALRGADIRMGSEVVGQSLLQILPVVVGYSWTARESIRYHGMMRRRLRLGIGDPLVCNRFLLWGAIGVTVAVGALINGAALIRHIDVLRSPVVLLASSCTGVTQAVLLFLAFLPPRAYQSWVAARAARAS
jgi:hypothetical protein